MRYRKKPIEINAEEYKPGMEDGFIYSIPPFGLFNGWIVEKYSKSSMEIIAGFLTSNTRKSGKRACADMSSLSLCLTTQNDKRQSA